MAVYSCVQMAKDIALHHNILRGLLHRYNGYEVATEGDSFKCAFSTPEDAVLWCMVVQVLPLTKLLRPFLIAMSSQPV